MEPHHLNKSHFVRHMKDAVPPLPHRRDLGAWESTSAEKGQALGVQPVSACLLGPGVWLLPLCLGFSGWTCESCCFLKVRLWQKTTGAVCISSSDSITLGLSALPTACF